MYRLIVVQPDQDPIIIDCNTIQECLDLVPADRDEIWQITINYIGG